MALVVGTYLFYRSAHMDAAVTLNHEMITYAEKATLTMPTVYVSYGVVATLSGRTAMNNDFLNLAHNRIIMYN